MADNQTLFSYYGTDDDGVSWTACDACGDTNPTVMFGVDADYWEGK